MFSNKQCFEKKAVLPVECLNILAPGCLSPLTMYVHLVLLSIGLPTNALMSI